MGLEMVGSKDGDCVVCVGHFVGMEDVGLLLGQHVGCVVTGFFVGPKVGLALGAVVGLKLGPFVGSS